MSEMEFLTIRDAAKRGPMSEHWLRVMVKKGKVPGIRSGNRFLVNYPALLETLAAMSWENVRIETGANERG